MKVKSTRRFLVEVEEALGPGLDYSQDPERGFVVSSARAGSLWLGVDRGFLVDSDDGRGRCVPVLLALPSSSSAGVRVDAELIGGFDGPEPVLVARLPGTVAPIEPVLRAAARIQNGARWIEATEAADRAASARRAYRERQSQGRITGGQAWLPPEGVASSSTTSNRFYSETERSLDRLPPRYLRGLEGVLDADERLQYSIQRPWRTDAGLVSRLRGDDRRSGLLLLTDREVLWLTDHFNPDSYLSDWGVDVELLPVERLTAVRVEEGAGVVRLAFDEAVGQLAVTLPVELEREAAAMAGRVERFLPERNRHRLRRRYDEKPVEFVEETAARFGQVVEARAAREAAERQAGKLLAFLYSPKREGQRRSMALSLSEQEVGLVGGNRISIAHITGLGMSLSPLTAQLTLRGRHGSISFPYPGPLAPHGAAFMRRLRKVWANSTT